MPTVRTALVVETEFLIALDFQRMLEALGIDHVLLARNLSEVEQLRATTPDIALAVIEIGIYSQNAHALARHLVEEGIPVLLTTAFVAHRHGVPELPDLPVLLKPVSEEMMASAVERALATKA